jgi:hypothetical protein
MSTNEMPEIDFDLFDFDLDAIPEEPKDLPPGHYKLNLKTGFRSWEKDGVKKSAVLVKLTVIEVLEANNPADVMPEPGTPARDLLFMAPTPDNNKGLIALAKALKPICEALQMPLKDLVKTLSAEDTEGIDVLATMSVTKAGYSVINSLTLAT